MSYIFCLDKKNWQAFTEEVKVALGADGETPVWLGTILEDGSWFPVPAVEGADGSCWTAHAFSEEQIEELKAWIPDKVQVLDKLPEGWEAMKEAP